jgi:aminodeoxychorismate lyase
MIVFLNGRFIPEEQAMVSVFDRSFLYGDGLFETMLVANGVPFCWEQHIDRLQRGAVFLGIRFPFSADELRGFSKRLLRENQASHALLRLTLSRGTGLRGYSPRGANSPILVMTLHPTTGLEANQMQSWRLTTSTFRLPAREPLAQFKNCNKLPQILARAQADEAGADEALLLNTDSFVVEGASSNFFWIDGGIACTPPLASGILSGVTRQVVLELCRGLGLDVRECTIRASQVLETEGVFLTLSSLGIVEGGSLDGQRLRQSPVTRLLHAGFLELLRRETGEH